MWPRKQKAGEHRGLLASNLVCLKQKKRWSWSWKLRIQATKVGIWHDLTIKNWGLTASSHWIDFRKAPSSRGCSTQKRHMNVINCNHRINCSLFFRKPSIETLVRSWENHGYHKQNCGIGNENRIFKTWGCYINRTGQSFLRLDAFSCST